MKKLMAFLLVFVCLFGYAIGDSLATPTDLVEIDDDDWGSIDIEFPREVYIDISKDPDDMVTLTAILVNFKQDDIVNFKWQYSTEQLDWIFIDDATEQTYTFMLDDTNMNYWYRVIVNLEGE